VRNTLKLAGYGVALVLGLGLGLYKGEEYGRTRAGIVEFAETLRRDPFESIVFEEGTDEAKVDLIRAQLAFKDRQTAKGAPLASRGETDYVIGYARLAVFSELKGDSVSAADYLQRAIAHCLKGKRKDDCDAEKLRYLADLIDHRKALPEKDAK